MKVALIHDSLLEFGGQERILQALLKAFPGSEIYTSYTIPGFIRKYFPETPPHKFHFSFLNNTYLINRLSFFQSISPFVWSRFDIEKYDLVISNSGHLLCNLVTTKSPIHIQYLNYPPKNLFNITEKRPFQKIVPYTRLISEIYRKKIKKTGNIITISKHMRNIFEKLFNVHPQVIYPPVKIPKLVRRKNLKYYVSVSRLDPAKNLECAIEACSCLNLNLKIIGIGEKKYSDYLKSLAGPTVEFLGYKTDTEISNIYQSAKGLIFCSNEEDFGIAPVEAMAHGTPVITFYGGGVKETVIQNKTGLFFFHNNSKSLINILKNFNNHTFDELSIQKHAKKFSDDRFVREINDFTKRFLLPLNRLP